MDFYNAIKELNDEELEETVKKLIHELEEVSNDINNNLDTIGFVIDANPEVPIFKNDSEKIRSRLSCNFLYSGYIPLGTRVVYGVKCFSQKGFHHGGCYYYMDDDSYILDFCKYIKTKDVKSDYHFFQYVLSFLNDYFGYLGNVSADNMLELLRDKNGIHYEPYYEHGISWFHKAGNAECSEYSAMANNILNVFGYFSSIVIGNESLDGEKSDHAYNIVSFVEDDTEEVVNSLMDFSNPVWLYDMNFKPISKAPFIIDIEDYSQEFRENFARGEEGISSFDYCYLKLGDETFCLDNGMERVYSVDKMLNMKKEKIKKR